MMLEAELRAPSHNPLNARQSTKVEKKEVKKLRKRINNKYNQGK